LGFTVIEPADSVDEVVPFEVGNIYHRQRDIHQVYGGQERGGIATPDGVPYVFLFTGETGEQYGYSDGWRPDGIFGYTGEGQRGDMEFVRGNRAIRDHRADGRDLLLFEATKEKGKYRFRGCFGCAGWEVQKQPDKDGNTRDAIVFHLVPVSEIETATKEFPDLAKDQTKTIEELRLLALAAAEAPQTPPKDSRRAYFKRSAVVKAYVLARAAGCCEVCEKPAPFKRKDGSPYLEPHHTLRLADEGPDHPRWVGAVCPSCHREIHHGVNGNAINIALKQKLGELWEAAEQAASPAHKSFG
jgi:5-methylcytosine-specific restriction protein A